MFTRAIVIVLDSVGIGELPDAGAYGDEGSNTLGNIAASVPVRVPALRRSASPVLCRCLQASDAGTPAGAFGPDGGAIQGQGLGHRALGADGRGARPGVSHLSVRVRRPT